MTVYLGLGSNLGDREAFLRQGLALLARFVDVRDVSSLYETEPVGYAPQGRFLNAVAAGETELPPEELLKRAKEVERALGRLPAFRNGPRVIDLDVISYGDVVMDTELLQLPHPRLTERHFVLVPLAEIAPSWRHPVLGRTATELLSCLGPAPGVSHYKGSWWP